MSLTDDFKGQTQVKLKMLDNVYHAWFCRAPYQMETNQQIKIDYV